jgi:DNA-binding NtrC family response regulator
MHFHVNVPSLRQRREDIPALAAHFIRVFSTELKRRPLALSVVALDRLMEHHYPGNIRELKNTIERAIIYAGGEHILADHIVFAPQVSPAGGQQGLPSKAAAGAARLLGVDRAKIYRWQQGRPATP